MRQVPKLNGADIELGNFVLGVDRRGTTCREASRALLSEIDGIRGGSPNLYAGSPYPVRRSSAYGTQAYRSDPYAGDEVRYVDGHGYAWTPGDDSVDGSYDSQERHRTDGVAPIAPYPYAYNAQDWGRTYLPTNGGCAYIDLDHLELCLPECLSAWDHVACWHAQLRLAQRALLATNEKLPDDVRVLALVNNSDGLGNSYGSHLDFLVTRRMWNDLFHRRPHYLGFLAAYQVSSIVFTGAGKVGSENGLPGDGFQISQRADMIETLVGQQTTYRRPLLNTRDEPLCGPRWRPGTAGEGWTALGDDLARLHVIFYDNTLQPTACLLKVGVMQIILAMLEARSIDVSLSLDDPLLTLWVWSRDPDLETAAPLCSGERLTGVELQRRFAEAARRFVESGGCDGIVPRAAEILDLWEDTLERLELRDFDALAGRLDWVLKRSIVEGVKDSHGLDWTAPELKHLDLMYSSLDPDDGLFWAYRADGRIEEPVSADRIEHFTHHPPEDTRAWGRAMLLRTAGNDRTVSVDWDAVEVRVPRGVSGFTRRVRVDFSDPLGSTREELEHVFADADECALREIVDRLCDRTEENVGDTDETESRRQTRPTPVRLIPANTQSWRHQNGNA